MVVPNLEFSGQKIFTPNLTPLSRLTSHLSCSAASSTLLTPWGPASSQRQARDILIPTSAYNKQSLNILDRELFITVFDSHANSKSALRSTLLLLRKSYKEMAQIRSCIEAARRGGQEKGVKSIFAGSQIKHLDLFSKK